MCCKAHLESIQCFSSLDALSSALVTEYWRKFPNLHSVLQDEVKNLICTTLREREGEIIRLYYGIVDNECLTWEDISRR